MGGARGRGCATAPRPNTHRQQLAHRGQATAPAPLGLILDLDAAVLACNLVALGRHHVCGAIERQLDFPLGPKTSRQPLNQNPTDYQATAFRHLSGPPSLRDQVNGGNIPPRSQTGRGGV